MNRCASQRRGPHRGSPTHSLPGSWVASTVLRPRIVAMNRSRRSFTPNLSCLLLYLHAGRVSASWWRNEANDDPGDGSARWIKFEQMYYLHSWSADGTRIAYFYQDDSDFDDRLKQRLSSLRAKP